MAITSFVDNDTEVFFVTGHTKPRVPWRSIAAVARRKLDMLEFAHRLSDLRSPPANRLESLRGDLKGLFSIRINDQWRIVFRWTESGPADVRICDYH